MNFRSLELTEKSLVGVALLLSTFSHSLTWLFLAIFHNTEPRDRTDKNHDFILKILLCSNNLIQKMTSITPSISENIHLKVFFKKFAQNFSPISRF